MGSRPSVLCEMRKMTEEGISSNILQDLGDRLWGAESKQGLSLGFYARWASQETLPMDHLELEMKTSPPHSLSAAPSP